VPGNPGHSFQYDDEIGELKELEKAACTWLKILTELEELDLPDNYLEELPTSINKLRNLTLRLDENQLRDLPQAIAELSNLTILSASNQLPVLPSRN